MSAIDRNTSTPHATTETFTIGGAHGPVHGTRINETSPGPQLLSQPGGHDDASQYSSRGARQTLPGTAIAELAGRVPIADYSGLAALIAGVQQNGTTTVLTPIPAHVKQARKAWHLLRDAQAASVDVPFKIVAAPGCKQHMLDSAKGSITRAVVDVVGHAAIGWENYGVLPPRVGTSIDGVTVQFETLVPGSAARCATVNDIAERVRADGYIVRVSEPENIVTATYREPIRRAILEAYHSGTLPTPLDVSHDELATPEAFAALSAERFRALANAYFDARAVEIRNIR